MQADYVAKTMTPSRNIQAKGLIVRRGIQILPPPVRCRSLLLVVVLLWLLLPVGTAAHTYQIITVTQDSAICYADSDGCYNYILQNDQWLKATGKKLRAGRSFLHTTLDITREDSGGEEALAQMLQQECDSFRLETTTLLSRLSPYLWFLLGVGIWFGGLWLHRWTRRRRIGK